jgi:ABC-type Fe3+ transport system permease subunit
VVILIQTIFLLGIFGEIFTTTKGGPSASTTLPYLIYKQALLAKDIGLRLAAGGIIAVILANIVAIFLMRDRSARTWTPEEGPTWPAPSPPAARRSTPHRRLGGRALIFFPILWTILTSFKTEGHRHRLARPVPVRFDWTLENYARSCRSGRTTRFFWNSVVIAVGSTLLGLVIAIPAAWSMAFVPGRRTKDLLMWMLSTKMMPAVGVLIPIYLIFREHRPARHAHRAGDRADADQPADHRLDALHLLQGNPRRDPRGRADGRRDAPGPRSSMS